MQTIEKPTKHGKFKRIEDKVLLSQKQASCLLEDVNRHMTPSYLHKGTVYTLIASHYFDSAELGFFRHHFLKAPKRYKLRIRRYAPNGVWSGEAPLIELKSKELGISRKRRFALTPENYERVMDGKIIKMTDEMLTLNPRADRDKLLNWMTKINNLILEYDLKPALKVRYRRLAFEAADGFRLTMDMDLKIEALDLDVAEVAGTLAISREVWDEAGRVAAKYERERHCVVELKHTGRPPEWVESFLKKHQIVNTSFSKYCWAVNETAGPETSAPEAADARLTLAGAY